MKKGLSILAAVLLAAGLCSCGPSPRGASTADPSDVSSLDEVVAVRTQPLCLAQFMCPV
jgi:hypothetical protein